MDDLNSLEGLAASTDAKALDAQAVQLPVDPDAPPPPPSLEEQTRDGVNMMFGMAINYCEELKPKLTEKQAEAWTAVLTPLAIKYNWNMHSLPPELMAAFVIVPTVFSCVKIVAEVKKRERMNKPVENNEVQEQQQQMQDVPPGAEVHSQMGLYPAL